MSGIDDLRSSKAQEWVDALEKMRPADGHFGPDILEAAGEPPIVTDASQAGATPEERADSVWADRLRARIIFKSVAEAVVKARVNGKIGLRRMLVDQGVTGRPLESVEREEAYWGSVAQWLEGFKP